jgi:hypothetical protein
MVRAIGNNLHRGFTHPMQHAARGGAHWLHERTRGFPMKPVWTQTLAWIAAVIAAVLLALASPGMSGLFDGDTFSHASDS